MLSLICDRDILAGFDKVTQVMISTHQIGERIFCFKRMTNKRGGGKVPQKKVEFRKEKI